MTHPVAHAIARRPRCWPSAGEAHWALRPGPPAVPLVVALFVIGRVHAPSDEHGPVIGRRGVDAIRLKAAQHHCVRGTDAGLSAADLSARGLEHRSGRRKGLSGSRREACHQRRRHRPRLPQLRCPRRAVHPGLRRAVERRATLRRLDIRWPATSGRGRFLRAEMRTGSRLVPGLGDPEVWVARSPDRWPHRHLEFRQR